MGYWLYKSEPFKWSWQMQKDAGEKGTEWTGVRNYLARNNMRAMQIGDKGFFYHSNEGLEIVGITEVPGEIVVVAEDMTARARSFTVGRHFHRVVEQGTTGDDLRRLPRSPVVRGLAGLRQRQPRLRGDEHERRRLAVRHVPPR